MTSATLLGKEVPSITVTFTDEDGGPLHGFGLPTDAFACGREFFFAEICPEEPDTTEIEDSRYGYLALPFAIAGRQKFPVRCDPGLGARAFLQAFKDAAEWQFGQILWFGDPNWADGSGGETVNLLYLTSSEIPTSSIIQNDVREDIATVLADAYEAHPDIDPILHLGYFAAMRAGTDALDTLNIPYVVNPAYPIDGIAVTGPIKIVVGPVQDLTHVDWEVNRRYAETTRMGLIQFDPCLARLGVTGS